MRLIDANELETQFRSTKIIEVFPEWEELSFQTKHKLVHYGKEVKRIVQSAPTVDAVEVVRCKDCKHRKEWLNGGTFYCQNPDFGMASGVALQDNDFCSYGERKDNEED